MMIGAPAWFLGNLGQPPSFQPPIPYVQPSAPGWAARPTGLGLTQARWADQQLAGITDIFDSPLWKYKKPLILGGVGLMIVGALALAGVVLK